jgi:HEAT repeat protein
LTKRRLLWLGAGLVAVLLAALLLLWSCYAVPGLLRGEHFYRGLPSGYWRKRVKDWRAQASARRPPWPPLLLRVADFLGLGPRSAPKLREPEALPVLLDLIDDPDPLVRIWVVDAVRYGPAGELAVPALIAALSDPDSAVKYWAVDSLSGMGRSGLPAVPALAGLVGDARPPRDVSDPSVFYPPTMRLKDPAEQPIAALKRLCPGAIPVLVKALKHPDSRICRGTAEALRTIDPVAAARAGVP